MPGQPQVTDPWMIRCPRCSAPVGPDQDWCLECGAPARTRLAPTPNWRLPTVAVGAIVAIAGALLAFAFVELTDDDALPVSTTPTTAVQPVAPAAIAPPVATAPVTVPPGTATTPAATVPAAPGPTTAPTTAPQPASTVPSSPGVTTATTPQGAGTVPRR